MTSKCRFRAVAYTFGVLAMYSIGCGGEGPTPKTAEAPMPETAEAPVADVSRDSVRVFWENYREATRLRQAADYEAAAVTYEAALEQNPMHHDALYYLGNVRLELGRWDAAKEVYMRLVEADPGSVRGHAQLGTLAFCRPETPTFDLAAADSSFERANALNPGETGPVLRLAEISIIQGRLDDGTSLLGDVLGSDGHNLEALYLRAFVAWRKGRAAAGIAELNGVLSHMEMKPVAPIAGEGDTAATGGGGPAYAAGAACPLVDHFVLDMRRQGAPVEVAAVENRFRTFQQRIASLPDAAD